MDRRRHALAKSRDGIDRRLRDDHERARVVELDDHVAGSELLPWILEPLADNGREGRREADLARREVLRELAGRGLVGWRERLHSFEHAESVEGCLALEGQ